VYNQYCSSVTRNVRLKGAYYVLTLEYTPTADHGEVVPGQFVMMRPRLSGGPLLPRPMSILEWREKPGGKAQLDIFYKVHGAGTDLMTTLTVEHQVDLLAPLGNGFPDEIAGPVLLVGGGVGIPPLVNWARELHQDYEPGSIHYFVGGRTHKDIFFDRQLERLRCKVHVATNDGSRGHHGFVTGPLETVLTGLDASPTVLTCGPMAMMQAVAKLCETHGATCLASLEAYMACGFGVCLGCVVPDKTGDFIRLCVDGPVMDTSMVDIHSEYLGGLG
jgi:dihydroorotate dehydrogenase electron transfer subunit